MTTSAIHLQLSRGATLLNGSVELDATSNHIINIVSQVDSMVRQVGTAFVHATNAASMQ